MISSDLLQILCCPENKTELTLVDPKELDTVNSRIQKKELQTVAGKTVTEPLSAALIRKDRTILYRIQNDIPILLIQEGIKL